MPSRDLETWMWSEAVRMLDRAEHLQRHFFQPGQRQRPQWEPPVDVYETGDAIWVVAALPGVVADSVFVQVREGQLAISGERRLPQSAHDGAVHRMEIPHGRFERVLALPRRPLDLASRELVDGCLFLKFNKA